MVVLEGMWVIMSKLFASAGPEKAETTFSPLPYHKRPLRLEQNCFSMCYSFKTDKDNFSCKFLEPVIISPSTVMFPSNSSFTLFRYVMRLSPLGSCLQWLN
jgi:hypothetical protein